MIGVPPVSNFVERVFDRLTHFARREHRGRRVRRDLSVRAPDASASSIACSISAASFSIFALKRSSIAALAIAPIGLARPLPAMSGADPWTGS
jgi:hypothetical protein